MASGDETYDVVAIAKQLAAETGRDWFHVLAALRLQLSKIAAQPIVAGDPECDQIFASMAAAADMVEFAAELDRLAARVAHLLVAEGRPAEEVEQLVSGSSLQRRGLGGLRAAGSDSGGRRSRLRL